MFRKENGVTLVALVITIIVLLILAGVTISMVLGDEGIIAQASGASSSQSLANVKDQATVAYATVRTADVGRQAGLYPDDGDSVADYAQGIATEMQRSGAFEDSSVAYSEDAIYVKIKATKNGYDFFKVEINEDKTVGKSSIIAEATTTNTEFEDATLVGTIAASKTATY